MSLQHLCVNFFFIYEGHDVLFIVDSEPQIFLRNFSWQFYLHSEFLFLEAVVEIFFLFRIVEVVWSGQTDRGLTSNKPIHNLLDYGDY